MTLRPDQGTLPGREALLAACRGWPPTTDSPILAAAVELSELHEIRMSRPDGDARQIDRARLRWAAAIDYLVASTTPAPSPGAPLHTETLGQIIDRMAQLTAHAFAMLIDGLEMPLHDIHTQLDDLAKGYEDLAAEVLAGTRRLPVRDPRR
ncbi:DUF4254 domain-containing protein [Nocardia pneumoniae]|uniref:DUF4254 domain-containing protein n=1 Tax=Nocardia pneumoniae TaxID=228601 RepID=UPI0006855B48|nr:DUF4254 domain-containing protein [Nocardia pneumoniae]